MKQVLTLTAISILILLSSCKDEFGFSSLTLKEKDKNLLKELANQLKTNPEITQRKLGLVLSSKPSFEEIDATKANALFNDYIKDRQPGTVAAMRRRYADAKFQETRSVVFPADSLYNYILSAYNTGKVTGIRFVFGGYERDKKKYNSANDSGDVTYSGRTCLFMLTTIFDSTMVNGAKKYYWRDSVRTVGAKSISEGFGIYNHGSLCPADCFGTTF